MLAGIDFATASGETWLATGEERGGKLVVEALDRVTHAEIPARIAAAQVTGIDVPLGWPDAFQEAMRHHRADRPRALPQIFPARLTDERVARELGLTPLSVAADLIGRCAWQAASILAQCPHRLNPVEPCSEPCVIEVYPKAALRVFAGKQRFKELKRYKSGAQQKDMRRRICEEILSGARFAAMLESHDALDAVLALHAAAAFARGEVVFPNGAEKEQASREGWIYYPSVFEAAVNAIVAGDAEALGNLLRANPALVEETSPRAHRSTLLHYVSANGVEQARQITPPNIVEIASLLLDAGADVNAESDAYGGGSTALNLTATSIHPERAGVQIALLELLLDRGARIRAGDVRSCLANGRGAAAEFLASRGAPLNFVEAAGIGRLDLVRGQFDASNMTEALGWACQFSRRDVVAFLIDQDPSREALDRGIHWAAYAGDPELVKLLLAHGAPRDEKDQRFGATPLQWAMHAKGEGRAGRFDEIAALLRR